MSTVFSVQDRLPLLMIHGLLHLLGYDHETEKEWQEMTRREDEIIRLFYKAKKERDSSSSTADISNYVKL
jgi:probable rRNA maturation factor